MELHSVAIIPARAGSKRLPAKNVKIFNGRPLIDWTVRAAIDSHSFDRVIITTDDDDIINLYANVESVDVVKRSEELASDDAKSVDVVLDVLKRFGLEQGRVALLQPTSPLRTSEHIIQAISLFNAETQNSVVSVRQAIEKIEWCKKLDTEGRLEELADENSFLSEIYIPNGAIYIFDIKRFIVDREIYFETKPYVMDNMSSIDIDYPIDFEMALLISQSMAKSCSVN